MSQSYGEDRTTDVSKAGNYMDGFNQKGEEISLKIQIRKDIRSNNYEQKNSEGREREMLYTKKIS